MARYERRMFFERLIELRAAHAAAGDDDRIATISMEDAIAEAEAALRAMWAADEGSRHGEATTDQVAVEHPDDSGMVR